MKKIMKKNRRVDVSKEVIKYSPSDYPLLTILKNEPALFSESCCATEIRWFEDNNIGNNYLQIFRTDFSNLKNKKEKAIEHLKDIEEALWIGEKECPKNNPIDIDMPGVRKMDGIIKFLKRNKNIFKLKKDFSKKEFNNFLRKGFIYGDDLKMLFVDEKSFKYLLKMYKNNPEKQKGASSIFKKSFKLTTAFGDVNVIEAPSLTPGIICLLDMNCVCYRYLNGRDTKLCVNTKKVDSVCTDLVNTKQKEKKIKLDHYYITECSLVINSLDYHLLGMIK